MASVAAESARWGIRGMASVVFQEVVHSARTEEAEVAKLQCSTEDRMDIDKDAPLTPKDREAMVRSVIDGGHSKAPVRRRARVCRQVGRTVPHRRRRWLA